VTRLATREAAGFSLPRFEPDSPADEAGIERGLVIYQVDKSDVNSAKQIENLLGRVQSGANVNFTVGLIRAGRQDRQLATLTLAAR